MKNTAAWIGGVLLFMLVPFLAWRFAPAIPSGPSSKHPLVPGPPIETLVFADGFKLEIFGINEDEWLDGSMTPPRRWIGAARWGSSSEALGLAKDELKLDRYLADDEPYGFKYSYDPGHLMMSVRYLRPNGHPIPPDRLAPGDLEIRLSDTAGEWISGMGPHGVPEDPESRGVLGFAGWPRSGTELVFQAIRPGEPPVEFRIPNPYLSTSIATWKALPLPQVQKDHDWEVRLKEVAEHTVPGVGTVLKPSFEFKSRFPKKRFFEFISGDELEAIGARGTRSGSSYRDGSKKIRERGYVMPPDEPMIMFRYRLKYWESYPFPRADTTIIGKGEVAADGKSISLTLDPNRLGLDSVELGTIGSKKGSRFPGKHSFELKMDGEWESKIEESTVTSRYGEPGAWRVLLFLDGGAFSTGALDWSGGGQSSSFGKRKFNWRGNWSGDLKPGMKVELGITDTKRTRILEFTVNRTDFIRK